MSFAAGSRMVPGALRRSICKGKGSHVQGRDGAGTSGAAGARFEPPSNSPPCILILAPSLDEDLTSVGIKAEFTALSVGQDSTGLQPCARRSRARGSERQLEQLENILSPAEREAQAPSPSPPKALLWQGPKPLFHRDCAFS